MAVNGSARRVVSDPKTEMVWPVQSLRKSRCRQRPEKRAVVFSA
jgi:hypothetical protein